MTRYVAPKTTQTVACKSKLRRSFDDTGADPYETGFYKTKTVDEVRQTGFYLHESGCDFEQTGTDLHETGIDLWKTPFDSSETLTRFAKSCCEIDHRRFDREKTVNVTVRTFSDRDETGSRQTKTGTLSDRTCSHSTHSTPERNESPTGRDR
jgi:hypothetical protein